MHDIKLVPLKINLSKTKKLLENSYGFSHIIKKQNSVDFSEVFRQFYLSGKVTNFLLTQEKKYRPLKQSDDSNSISALLK